MRLTEHGVGLVAVVWALGATGAAAQADTPTFTEDVAPILYENCVVCHRAGETAPMSLITYQETRPWSRSIKSKVLAGEMPPWHADPSVGRFLNERRLTDAERDTIVAWVDAGAPEGDPARLPAAPTFSPGWRIGTPDAVIEMPAPFEVAAEGEIAYQYFTAETNFTEDTWVKAIEVRAGSPAVVHHILAYARAPGVERQPSAFRQIATSDRAEALAAARERQESGLSTAGGERPARRAGGGPGTLIGTMAPGTNPMVFEPDTAFLIPKGTTIVFQVHYTANGEPTMDRSRVGLVFAEGPPKRELRVSQFINAAFEIPAGASDVRIDGVIEFTEDAQIHAIFPHTHVRGKKWLYELVYPDGRREPVLSVPEYDFNWQTYYQFEEPVEVPSGTRLEAAAWYDNSPANRANPDPTMPVRWGEQTWEEMHYTGITYSVKDETEE